MRLRIKVGIVSVGVALAAVAAMAVPAQAGRIIPVGPPSPAPRTHITIPGPLRILTLGDSITEPCGQTPPAGYCAKLGALLDQAGVDHVFINRALSGTACDYTASHIHDWLIADHPGLVLLDCGTNNVPTNQATMDAMGEQWRTIVEAVHAAGIPQAGSYITFSDPEVNAAAGRSWLVPGEINAQTVLRTWYNYEIGFPTWAGAAGFAGWADFSTIPGNRTYLRGVEPNGSIGGIHPTQLGWDTMGVLWYRSLAVNEGWPAIIPQPCGLWGHAPVAGATVPAYTECVSTS